MCASANRFSLFFLTSYLLASPPPAWNLYLLRGNQPSAEPAQIVPGGQARFVVASNMLHIGTTSAFPLKDPLSGIRWTIEPTGRGVVISSDGVVTAQPAARPGAYTVVATANGETRRKPLQVYSASEQPIVGVWSEAAQVECETAKETPPRSRIGELVFQADGGFSVTWHPFETYRDYTGTYEYSRSDGRITLKPANLANFKPADLHPAGTARIDSQGRLVLAGGLWLGTGRNMPGAAADSTANSCGQIFTRIDAASGH